MQPVLFFAILHLTTDGLLLEKILHCMRRADICVYKEKRLLIYHLFHTAQLEIEEREIRC